MDSSQVNRTFIDRDAIICTIVESCLKHNLPWFVSASPGEVGLVGRAMDIVDGRSRCRRRPGRTTRTCRLAIDATRDFRCHTEEKQH